MVVDSAFGDGDGVGDVWGVLGFFEEALRQLGPGFSGCGLYPLAEVACGHPGAVWGGFDGEGGGVFEVCHAPDADGDPGVGQGVWGGFGVDLHAVVPDDNA